MLAGPRRLILRAIDATAGIGAQAVDPRRLRPQDITGGGLQHVAVPQDVTHRERAAHGQAAGTDRGHLAPGQAHRAPHHAEAAVVAILPPSHLNPGLTQQGQTGGRASLDLFWRGPIIHL
ncbi:hypothetical protein D3C71_1502760 [compost metagenome]